MKTYYFTFGTDEDFPFQGGWVEVVAPNIRAAARIFKAYFPNDNDPDILNCADYYSEEVFRQTEMMAGNMGAGCHLVIGPYKPKEV